MKTIILILLGAFIAISVIVLILVTAGNKSKNTINNTQNLSTSNSQEKSSVPLPRQEDVINLFFNLIDEDRASEAISMLTAKNIADDANKQAWGVQFNAIDSVAVKSIEKTGENTYKVTLGVVMKPGMENAQPMPYYGWGDGEFVRWVTLEKDGLTWKISEIATGP
jgi:hypothetical protein